MSAVAGWYTDPSGAAGQLRWWDGSQWTDHVTPDPDMIPVQEPEMGPDALAGDASEDGTTEPAPERSDAAPAAQADQTPPAQHDAGTPDPVPVPSDVSTAGATSGSDLAPAWASSATAASTGAGTGSQPPPPSGDPSPEARWGTSADDARAVPGWQAAELTPRSGTGVKTALIVAAVIAVLAVLVVGAAFVGLVGGFGSVVTSGPFATDEEWLDDGGFEDGGFDDFGGGGGEVVHGGELVVGETVRGSVPRDGTFEVDLVVEAPGEVTIDVRGGDHFDAVAEIVDETGQTLDYNDDRSGVGGAGGGNDLDPWLAVDLEPGTYQVRVRGFSGEEGSIDIRTS